MALNIHDNETNGHIQEGGHIKNGKRNSNSILSVDNQYDDFEHSRSVSVEQKMIEQMENSNQFQK